MRARLLDSPEKSLIVVFSLFHNFIFLCTQALSFQGVLLVRNFEAMKCTMARKF